MALVPDASSPARFENFAGPSSITSASFTAPANTVLLASMSGAGDTASITVTDSGGLTWTTCVAKRLTGSGNAWSYMAWAIAPTAVARTVTVTFASALSIGASAKVDVWTGADTSSPIGATNSGASTSNPLNVGLTTLNANSRVIGCAVEWNALAGLTSTDTKDVSGTASVIRVYKAADTATPSAVTLNFSVTSGTPDWAWAAIELKAAGATAPDQVTGVTLGTLTSTTAPLSWTAPGNGGSAITDYNIQKRQGTFPALVSQAAAPSQLTAIDGVAGTAFQHRWTGVGVTIYNPGAGIRGTHNEFTGRLGAGYDATGTGADPFTDYAVLAGLTDGHDTGVAACAMGTTYGVAKGATIYPIQLLTASEAPTINVANCPPAARVIDACQHILAVATPGAAVVNWSIVGFVAGQQDWLGATITSTDVTNVTAAFQDLIDAGIMVVAAAGNSNTSTITAVPQNMTDVICVANIDADLDGKSPTSNFGSGIDYWACGYDSAGANVTAGAINNTDTVTAYDGTSEAAGQASGSVACLQEAASYAVFTRAEVGSYLDAAALTATGSLGTGSPTKVINANTEPGNWSTFSDGTSTATSATVTGLTHGYWVFQVRAVNAIGNGAWSTSSATADINDAATVASSNEKHGTSLGTGNAQTLPSGAGSGDLVIYVPGVDNNGTSTAISASTGWDVISPQTQGSNVIKAAIIARVLDGTTGNNICSITGATQDFVAPGVRIPAGSHGVVNPATDLDVAATTGASGNADPPSNTYPSTSDWLTLAAAIVDLTTGNTISAVPANYTQLQNTVSASSTSSVAVAVASRREGSVSSADPGAFTNTSRPWIAYTVGIPKSSGALSLTLGQATETDTATVITATKTVTLGQAVETDTATVITASKSFTLGQAVETDTAQPITAAKTFTLGQAVETDTAQTVAATKTFTLGQAVETDTAQTVAATKTFTLGQAVETDTALPLVLPNGATVLGQAVETDTALPITVTKTATLDTAVETDTAQPLTAAKSLALAPAVETDTALPVGLAKSFALGTALETDTALPVAATKTYTLGVAVETDLALPLVFAQGAHAGCICLAVSTATVVLAATAAHIELAVTEECC